jgi:hypothetical protein
LEKKIAHLGSSNSLLSLFSQQNRGSSNSLSSQFSQPNSVVTMAPSINSAPNTVQHHLAEVISETETNTTEVVTAPKRSVSFFEKPTIIDDDDSDSSILQTMVFPSSVSMKEEPILENRKKSICFTHHLRHNKQH